jgi:hypothetical protein
VGYPLKFKTPNNYLHTFYGFKKGFIWTKVFCGINIIKLSRKTWKLAIIYFKWNEIYCAFRAL